MTETRQTIRGPEPALLAERDVRVLVCSFHIRSVASKRCLFVFRGN